MKKQLLLLSTLAVVTIVFGTVYATVQQSLRMSANDPQIEVAETMAQKINDHEALTSFTPMKIDMGHSLATFVIIYDKTGKAVAGNGYLNNQLPAIPSGVLKAADKHDYNAVTWQPENGVRIASVTVAADGYYITSGRSLKEVERRETNLAELVGLGWFGVVVVLFGSTFLSKIADSETAKKPAAKTKKK